MLKDNLSSHDIRTGESFSIGLQHEVFTGFKTLAGSVGHLIYLNPATSLN